jgi:DNA-binding beta-propeller fold protein YncE
MNIRLVTGLALSCALLVAPAFASPNQYLLKQKVVLGGEGGWDYLAFDPVGKRLFVPRGTHVTVVDPYKGSLIGEIPNTAGVHGVAFAQDLNKGFTSNGRDNTVTVFDLKTLAEIAKIKVPGDGPDAIYYDAGSKRVFSFNGRSKDATLIDAVANTVVSSIPLGGKPEFPAGDGKGIVFVNVEDTSELVSIDAKLGQVANRWKMAACESPTGLAMDTKHRRLFAGCSNKVMTVVNADSGAVVTTVPIGQGTDAIEFDAARSLAFSSNFDGTLDVVHEDSPDRYTVVQSAPTQAGARTMALDTTNHDIYLVTAEIEMVPATVAGQPPRRTMKPGTFTLLVMSTR